MTGADITTFVKKNPIPSICGLLSVLLAVGIYLRSDAIGEANGELDERATEAQRYAVNIANGVQLKEQYEAIVAANKEIASRMLRSSDIGINQQFFYKLESENGVKLTDVRQNARGATKGAYAPIGFSLTVQGDFPAVVRFMQALESGAHYCRVINAVCSGARSGPVTLTLNLEILGTS